MTIENLSKISSVVVRNKQRLLFELFCFVGLFDLSNPIIESGVCRKALFTGQEYSCFCEALEIESIKQK